MSESSSWTTVRKTKHVKKIDSSSSCNMNNNKKIMCNNMITSGECKYSNRCLYAHSYEEQNVDELRKKAYDIIMGKKVILYTDVICDNIYAIFAQLTHVCIACMNNRCPGGFNCKFGTFNKKYQVCYSDLQTGECDDLQCEKIHLSEKGIKPIQCSRDNFIMKNRPITTHDIEYLTKMKTHDIFAKSLLDYSDTSSEYSSDIDSMSFDQHSDDDCTRSIFV